MPLILFGHGAHLSKDDPIMQMIAKGFCRGVGAAVALMDCPGHGERRAPGSTEEEFYADVARRMSDAQNHAQLTDDWRAVEVAARAADGRITGPTGYAGFSMGSLFGLSIVADLPAVTAAVFALGGLQRIEARDELIRSGVSRLGGREVLMLNMTRDEHFPIDGAIEVLEPCRDRSAWPCGRVCTPTSRRRPSSSRSTSSAEPFCPEPAPRPSLQGSRRGPDEMSQVRRTIR